MLDLQDFFVSREGVMLFKPITAFYAAQDCVWVQGANGQGKTTLFRALVGLFQQTSGQMSWQTHYKPMLFTLNQGVHPFLTVRQNAKLFFKMINEKVTDDSLDDMLLRLQLLEVEAHPALSLSAGQKRKLALLPMLSEAAALRPWIIDEPFIALDQTACQTIEKLMVRHIQQQGFVMFSSHQAPILDGIGQHLQTLALQAV